MELIIAVLLWIGVIQPGQTADADTIAANEAAIQYYSQDASFLESYNTQRTADHIGMLDLNEGD